MAQEVNGQTLIAEAGVHLQAIPGGCFGVNGRNKTGLSPKNLAFFFHYRSTSSPDFLSYITDAV
jgi:hypothetical protein